MCWTRPRGRVDTGKLLINDSYELLIARLLGAVRSRGNNAPANVLGVAWVLAIGDRCGDERVLVLDTGRLCKVDYFVRVVLLVAYATCRKECIDAGDTGQVDTWVASEDVAITRELCVEHNFFSKCVLLFLSGETEREDGLNLYAHRVPATSARQREGRSV